MAKKQKPNSGFTLSKLLTVIVIIVIIVAAVIYGIYLKIFEDTWQEIREIELSGAAATGTLARTQAPSR